MNKSTDIITQTNQVCKCTYTKIVMKVATTKVVLQPFQA